MKSITAVAVAASLLVVGCAENESALAPADVSADPPIRTSPALPSSSSRTLDELRDELGIDGGGQFKKAGGEVVIADLSGTRAKTIEPLRGLKLTALSVAGTEVEDLSPVAGMPLEKLYGSDSAVSDLSGLAGMDLLELNLINTPVSDLKPLATSRLGTLWIRRTKVTDLSPLTSTRLVSLDVQDTGVTDLSPLSGLTTLKRLNIAGTDVTDVTPLQGLQLQRIILTPEKVARGMGVLRKMSSLQAIDTNFDNPNRVLTAAEFWRRWDAGEIGGGPAAPAQGAAP